MPRPFSWILLVAFAQCSLGAASPPLKKLGEERFAFGEGAAARVDRLDFDAKGRPRWDQRALNAAAIPACDAGTSGGREDRLEPNTRRVVMLSPRVDERRCPRAGGGSEAWLFGFDAAGAVTWQRPLAFHSGERKIEQWLLGAAPEGLVLSSLEVWSPGSGETIVPARTHPVGPEQRPVPDHQATGAAIYHPSRGEVLFFSAEVSLLRRDGGLYRFDLKSGAQELLRPVSAGLLGTHENVEAMALAPGGNLLLLARRSTVRDASPVSVAAFDLDRRRYVFEERHGEGHACSEPRVVVGPGGKVAFSYRNENQRQHVVVSYELLEPLPSTRPLRRR